jgi:hypothetical protein
VSKKIIVIIIIGGRAYSSTAELVEARNRLDAKMASGKSSRRATWGT